MSTTAPLVPVGWGLFVPFFVYGCGLVAAALGMWVGAAIVQPFGDADQVIWHMPAHGVFWCLGLWLVRRLDRQGEAALGLAWPAWPSVSGGVAWYLPLGLVWWVATYTYGVGLKAVGVPLPRQAVVLAFLADDLGLLRRVLMVVAIVVLAPLGEEMLFRGLLHGALRRLLPFWPAAILGGTAFGLLHLESSTVHSLLFVPPLALLGVMLAWLRERHGSLWRAVGLHAAHNAATLALLVLGS